jgi:flagellar basal-body rod protein FlgB
MSYLAKRQSVLAQNMAHIDTPNYKARDIKKIDFGAMVEKESSGIKLATTSPMHLGGTNAISKRDFRAGVTRDTFETSPTNNSVTLEDQMAKISENSANYEMSSSILKKLTAMYRSALGQR